MDIKFTDFPQSSNWAKGVVDNGVYSFEAKVFDEGSDYGIKNGRVSKLTISKGEQWRGFENCIVNYDRGWDIKPETEDHKNVFNEVLNFLENSPQRFD